MGEQYLTRRQVADNLGFCTRTIDRLDKTGRLGFPKAIRLPTGQRRWKAADLEAWAEGRLPLQR